MSFSKEDLKNLKPSEKEAINRILDGESLWIPQNKPQWQAYLSRADCVFLGGASGGGKLIGNDEICWTPFGPKRHGDLEVGDQVSNPDGSVARITAVERYKDVPLYRVTCIDGASVLAGANHNWLVRRSSTRYKADRRYFSGDTNAFTGDIVKGKVILTSRLKEMVDECQDNLQKGKRAYWPLIPLTNPVQFTLAHPYPDSRWPFDAYVLGVILGDGCITDGIGLTTMDPIIDAAFAKEMERLGASVRRDDRRDNQAWSVRVNSVHEVIQRLKKLGLYGLGSSEKFIPEAYKLTSIEDRRAILQGLMDTDGTSDSRGHCSFCSVSADLAKDVQWLARSLGYKATLFDKDPFYLDDFGKKVYCKKAYRVYIQGRNKKDLFRLERKKSRCTSYNGGISGPMRRIVNVEKEGNGDATCIQVDHPNGLYLTNDFIVTHNSQLLLGLAITGHEESIIFRREYKQLVGSTGLVSSSEDILRDTDATYNAHEMTWRGIPPNNTSLDFGAVKYEKDVNKYRGRPHDFIGFDELTEFSRYQFEFLQAWARSTKVGQRVRIVGTGNPPTTPQGRWIIDYWRPWLDSSYKNPAEPGELRYFVNLEGRDVETDGPEKVEGLIPQSRTFIPATVYDNPYYGDEYVAQLQALPEELRRAFLDGDFDILSGDDDPFQLIKYDWVRMAQERWKKMEKPDVLTHVGVDVARGGKDYTVLAPRHNNYIDELHAYPGKVTKRGNDIGVLIVELVGEQDPVINIDSIGVGGAAFDYVFDLDFTATAINFSSRSNSYDQSGRFKMRNKRAEFYWKLRESLDPDLDGQLALPAEDSELLEELTSIYYTVKPSGIEIEKKDKIKDRLGRSPDRADAVAYAMGERPIIFG